ncbi:MAG: aspartate-semialdehyde dehydrogenase [Firmicutes bacterium]|nr:aspartate-semialdehyde dehydrogenase [Bacillota bacterium]
MKKSYTIAVVGATGLVGRKMLEVMQERGLAVDNLYPFASARSAGKVIRYDNRDFTVLELTEENVKKHSYDFAVFSAGGETSGTFAPIFAKTGCVVVDNSSRWRMDNSVPLVVPEVNADALAGHNNIIANPNCSTIQAVAVLGPLHKKYGISRIVYSTYQAVSGAGIAGCEDLENGAKGLPPKKFTRPIYANLIPQIDVFLENGYTKEEEKMILETRKILADEGLRITATTVRVPVFNGHSESVNIEFKKPVTLQGVLETLKAAKGVVVKENPADFPTPLDCSGRDEVFVGRVRLDSSVKSGVNLWIVADNIRKGAATNTVQIVEELIRRSGT